MPLLHLKVAERHTKWAESGSYVRIATVNSVQINIQQYTCKKVTAHGNYMHTVVSEIPGILGN